MKNKITSATEQQKICSKCNGNDIEELLWVNQITAEITQREDQYFCNYCNAKVEIIVASQDGFPLSWLEDIEPLEESNLTTSV